MKFDTSVKWPHGARVAVMLTFDFDAETLWTSRNPDNVRRPGILSQGRYGAVMGVPKILETLHDAQVPATFFTPGWTVENHTDKVEMILKEGTSSPTTAIRTAGPRMTTRPRSRRWTRGSRR